MAVSHVKTNGVADFTGTVTVFNSQGSTVTANATDIIRPSDWNSVHNQFVTIAGNTSGQSTLSGTNIQFAGGNGVTLSANATQITVSVATNYQSQGAYLTTAMASDAATLSNVRVSGGTTSNLLSAITFADGNGVSFGLNAGTMTASHNALTSQSNQNVTAGNGGFAFQTLSFSNVNGVSFGTSAGSAITGSVAAQTNQSAGVYAVGNTTGQSSSSTYDARTLSVDGAGIVSVGWSNSTLRISATQSNQAFSADASSTFQTLTFQDSNGVSFSNNAGALRVTHALQYTSATSAITSAAQHTSKSVFTAYALSNTTQSSTGTMASSSLQFAGAGAVSVGVTNGSIVVSAPNTIAQTNQTVGVYGSSQTAGSASSGTHDARSLSFIGAGIISVGNHSTSAGGTTTGIIISATQSNQAFSAGAASSTFQTLSFQDSNGLSFSNNAGAIRVSYTRNVASNAIASVGSATNSGTNTSRFAADDHIHAGVFSVGVSTGGNTVGDTRVDVGRFVLAGSNAVTLSQATAANALNTIHIQGPVSATTISAVASVNTIGTRGSRFALEDHQHEGVFSAGVSNDAGNTVGDTRVGAGRLVLRGGNNITLSQITAAGALNTVGVSAPDYAASNSAGSFTFKTLNFSNANNVTFGTSAGGIITASVAAPGAAAENNWFNLAGNTAGNSTASGSTIALYGGEGITLHGTNNSEISIIGGGGGGGIGAGVSTGGNTAGSTGTVTTGNVVFVGSNGITLSQSTGAAGSAATITIQAWDHISSYENLQGYGTSAFINTLNGASISHCVAFQIPEAISASFIRLPVLMTTNSTTLATTGNANMSAELRSTFNAVVYSLGTGASSKSLISVASGSGGFTFLNSISCAANSTQFSFTQAYSAQAEGGGTTLTTQYSASTSNMAFSTNSWTAFTGSRFIDIPFANSLKPGPYWLVFGMSTSAATNSAAMAGATNCNVRYSGHYVAGQHNINFGIMGSSNLTSGGLMGAGSFSTAGGGTTSAFPISAISSSASNLRPYFQMLRRA